MRIRSSLATLAAAVALGGGAAQAQDKLATLKLSSGMPAHHPLNPSLLAWAESLKKATHNTVTSTLFPSGQLGKAGEHYDMARSGTADFAYVTPDDQPGRFPVLGAASLPFLFSSATGGTAALDAWYRQYAAREMKDVKFCFAFVHEPGTFHARRKIVLPGDVRGMAIRPATGAIGQLVTSLGGTNVHAPASVTRGMLERGAIDAIAFPWGSLRSLGLDKAVKYHLDVPLYVTPFVWVMNKARYASLSTAQKRAVDDHCSTEWAERVAAPWAEFESGGHEKLAQPGHEIYPLIPEQLKAWREAAAPLQGQWAEAVKKAGEDPKKVLESLKASLVLHKAAL